MAKKNYISRDGYKRDSKDRDNPFNIVPSNRLTMEGVDHQVLAIPMGTEGVGNPVVMNPGENYLFPRHDIALEIPLAHRGARVKGPMGPDQAKGILEAGYVLGHNLTDPQAKHFMEVAGIDLNDPKWQEWGVTHGYLDPAVLEGDPERGRSPIFTPGDESIEDTIGFVKYGGRLSKFIPKAQTGFTGRPDVSSAIDPLTGELITGNTPITQYAFRPDPVVQDIQNQLGYGPGIDSKITPAQSRKNVIFDLLDQGSPSDSRVLKKWLGSDFDIEEIDDAIKEYINTKVPFKKENGGTAELPQDYQAFLDYSKTAPENRQPEKGWEYGNPRQYDHYGMWEALGKPKDFEEAKKMNPKWTPDPHDNMYHGFSVNPNTGVWLKPHIPGESEPGSTAWMEANYHYLSPGASTSSLVFDPDLQRMRYIPKEKTGGQTIDTMSLNYFYDKLEKGGQPMSPALKSFLEKAQTGMSWNPESATKPHMMDDPTTGDKLGVIGDYLTRELATPIKSIFSDDYASYLTHEKRGKALADYAQWHNEIQEAHPVNQQELDQLKSDSTAYQNVKAYLEVLPEKGRTFYTAINPDTGEKFNVRQAYDLNIGPNPYSLEVDPTPWGDDQQKGDAFRKWVNTNYPDKAKSWDLDESGDPDNLYVRSAYYELGDQYKEWTNTQKVDTINSNAPTTIPPDEIGTSETTITNDLTNRGFIPPQTEIVNDKIITGYRQEWDGEKWTQFPVYRDVPRREVVKRHGGEHDETIETSTHYLDYPGYDKFEGKSHHADFTKIVGYDDRGNPIPTVKRTLGDFMRNVFTPGRDKITHNLGTFGPGGQPCFKCGGHLKKAQTGDLGYVPTGQDSAMVNYLQEHIGTFPNVTYAEEDVDLSKPYYKSTTKLPTSVGRDYSKILLDDKKYAADSLVTVPGADPNLQVSWISGKPVVSAATEEGETAARIFNTQFGTPRVRKKGKDEIFFPAYQYPSEEVVTNKKKGGANQHPYPTDPNKPDLYAEKKNNFVQWLQQSGMDGEIDQMIADDIEMFAEGGSKKWMQKARASMKRRGTEGSLTRQAKAAGFKTPRSYCESIGWKGKKCGFLKGVLSSQGKSVAYGGDVLNYIYGGDLPMAQTGKDWPYYPGRQYILREDHQFFQNQPGTRMTGMDITGTDFGPGSATIDYTATGTRAAEEFDMSQAQDPYGGTDIWGTDPFGIDAEPQFQAPQVENQITVDTPTNPEEFSKMLEESGAPQVKTTEKGQINFDRKNLKDWWKGLTGHEKANLEISGLNLLADFFGKDEERRREEQIAQKFKYADNLMTAQAQDMAGRRGNYLLNVQGQNFRPTAMGMGSTGFYGATAQKGGQVGEEVYMTEEEIKEFLRNGGSLEYV